VEVVAVHIPGVDNDEADHLSRFTSDSYRHRALSPAVLQQVDSAGRCKVQGVFQLRLAGQVPGRQCTPDPDAVTDAEIAPHSSLWCPGPTEFASTIKRVRRLAAMAPAGTRHIVLLPEQQHSPWWGLLSGSQEIRRWPAGSPLFETDIVLAVPNSVSPPITISHKTSVPWVARTFGAGSCRHARAHPRGCRK
jgi:hypothetical protein